MEQKTFLYIDILGFSDLVKSDSTATRRLYNIIENLNCHNHSAFKTIVFSDTILIYNVDDYLWEHEKCYFIQFQIEFAHDLFNQLAFGGYNFKALLLEGEFEHTKTTSIERYFGKVFIDAYEDQKAINCMGLFIEKKINKFNRLYKTASFNDKYDFVFLTQTLEIIKEEIGDTIPIERDYLDDTEVPYDLLRYIFYFKNLNHNQINQQDQRIKEKHKNTYHIYKKNYNNIIDCLEKNNFDPKSICKGINWRKYQQVLKYGVGGFGIKPPSKAQFTKVIEKAREAGRNAAIKYCEEKYHTKGLEDFPFLPCGGSWIVLDINTKTKLGKFLLSTGEEINRVSIHKSHNEDSVSISIYDMNKTQAKIFAEIANNEALKILKEELNVEGYVHVFWD